MAYSPMTSVYYWIMVPHTNDLTVSTSTLAQCVNLERFLQSEGFKTTTYRVSLEGVRRLPYVNRLEQSQS